MLKFFYSKIFSYKKYIYVFNLKNSLTYIKHVVLVHVVLFSTKLTFYFSYILYTLTEQLQVKNV